MSSCSVYGDRDEPVTVADAPRPDSAYALSKLRGERMLADSCPNCPMPLMQNDQGCICCLCHVVWERNAEGEYRRKARADAQKATATVQQAPRQTPAPREKADAPGVGSVGEKLLQGWTMLADSCPMCYKPLMRNPADRTMWCVACNVQAVEEAEYDASKHRLVNQPQKEEEKVEVPRRQVEQAAAAASGVEGLRRTLVRRLEAAQTELDSMSIHNVTAADRLLRHICLVAEALKALDGC